MPTATAACGTANLALNHPTTASSVRVVTVGSYQAVMTN